MGRTRRRGRPRGRRGRPRHVASYPPITRHPVTAPGRGKTLRSRRGGSHASPPRRVSRTHVQQRYYLTTHAQMCGSGATASKALFLSPQGAAATGRDRACRESQINLLSHSVA